jgi:sulfatase maturation enzyme AslB (radical SAM superfamily)
MYDIQLPPTTSVVQAKATVVSYEFNRSLDTSDEHHSEDFWAYQKSSDKRTFIQGGSWNRETTHEEKHICEASTSGRSYKVALGTVRFFHLLISQSCYIIIIMKTIEYKDFSWDLHKKAGHKPIVAQIELTYRCPLHCRHCYTDCYNNQKLKKDELKTADVKAVLDKCKVAGVTWLCLTGGDPMMRKDFITIYNYAKKLGFIINVFSPLTAMTDEIFKVFKKSPPFNIETTLNAATDKTYKKVTKTDLFKTHIKNIKRLIASGIEVRLKTQVTKDNIEQIDKIKALVEKLGKPFRPSTMLFARLNNNTDPCELRLEPKEAIRVNKKYGFTMRRSSSQVKS